ncbi:cGMP-dependent protein kinase 2 [Takifugu flavidus]|uniref:cGMP-dependent protein kinase 2 n=1 Tax=Takifugu flavidus TaxID=433684 RepID=A0A5C6PFX9_9TELE|nr:cGMP-dependent protein kinase 2 [Takifugu flavidus]
MVAMGNGSIKVLRPEENSCLASTNKDADINVLRLRINQLEAELECRDQELQAQKYQLHQLQKELEAKISQIDKLQDAIGYTHDLGHSPPLARVPHHSRRFSVINQGPSQFHRVAVEVHRRLRAKEGVSAEPNSGSFCPEAKAAQVSKATHKNSRIKKFINDAIMNNDFLNKLEPQHMNQMVDCMFENVYTEGQLVIREGEPGNYLYVLSES